MSGISSEQGEVKGAHDPPLHTVEDIERHLRLGGRLIYPHPTVMYRRDVVLGLGGYDKRYVSLFAGLVPASDPRLAVVVMVDDPKSTDAAGNPLSD